MSGPLFDRRAMLDNLDQDVELLQLLARTFLDDVPRLLADLHTTLARGDAPAAVHASHSLKGSVANFGAAELVRVVQALERCCRAGDLAGAAATVGDTERLVAALVTELEDELRQDLPSS